MLKYGERELMKNMEIQVKIDNFEGPLDLLIHLIEKKQMKITEINISQIIDDYLEIIKLTQKSNLRIKVEFLILATELIEIKAYSILNKEKKVEKEEDLEKRILEYKLFKEISEKFSDNECVYNIPYIRSGSIKIEEALVEYDISNLNITSLFNSFKNLISNGDKNKDSIVLDLVEDYSMDEANNEIENHLTINKKVSFSTLLNNKFTKVRIVSLFLATLDMFKIGKIDIEVENKEFYLVRMV